jgi:hypothetical protein
MLINVDICEAAQFPITIKRKIRKVLFLCEDVYKYTGETLKSDWCLYIMEDELLLRT